MLRGTSRFRLLPFLGPGLHRGRRLHRPGQLRDEHRRRLEVRLHARLGDRRLEPDGDADPDAVGEARDRDRAATSPRSAATASRAASSLGLWVQAEVIAIATDLAEFLGAALGMHLLFGIGLFPAALADRGRRVRDPRPAAVRLPPARGDDRRDRARDRRLLRRRALQGAARPRRGRQARRAAGVPGQRLGAARGRDPRRDRDAARDLAALGADAGSHPARERRSRRGG